MTTLKDQINQEAEKYGAKSQSSEFFKFEKGQNRIRILNQPAIIATHFFGAGQKAVVCVGVDEGCPHHKGEEKKPSLKLATYIIDRKDGEVKLAELPLSVGYAINDLQEDEDFAFDDFPMPYDIKVISDPDNQDPKAKYRVQPSPKKEEMTTEEKEAFDKEMEKITPEAYVEKRKEKQKKINNGDVEKTIDEIRDEADADAPEGEVPF